MSGGISTHILDTVNGGAAVGVRVTLFKSNQNGGWSIVNQLETGEDGRAVGFTSKEQFKTGLYKLMFATGDYFEKKNIKSIFPLVEVIFDCSTVEHYHIPLLISTYSYTTYRGK